MFVHPIDFKAILTVTTIHLNNHIIFVVAVMFFPYVNNAIPRCLRVLMDITYRNSIQSLLIPYNGLCSNDDRKQGMV